MIFLFEPEAGTSVLELKGDGFTHAIKARRTKTGELLALRHLRDDTLFTYTVTAIDRRSATLTLTGSEELPVLPPKPLHLGWSLVDPKTVEKTLPMLNELGVGRITFLPAARSQGDFRLPMERLERIIHLSCQQCGRSRPMALGTVRNLEQFLGKHPDLLALDFSDQSVTPNTLPETVLIGPEGGFTESERRLLDGRIAGLPTPLILRSETAAVSVAALAALA